MGFREPYEPPYLVSVYYTSRAAGQDLRRSTRSMATFPRWVPLEHERCGPRWRLPGTLHIVGSGPLPSTWDVIFPLDLEAWV